MNMDEWLQQARDHDAAGQWSDAAQCCSHILTALPGHAEAHRLRGGCFLRLGHMDAALTDFQAASTLDPGDGQAHLGLCHVLRLTGRLDEAAEAGHAAQRLLPRAPAAPLELGLILASRESWAEAAEFFSQALGLAPGSIDALASLAQAKRAMGEMDLAIELLCQAVTLAPDRAAPVAELAHTLTQAGRFAEALQAFAVALPLAPDDAGIHLNLGNLFTRMLRLDHAERCYRSALALAPDLVVALVNLGSTLLDQGRFDEAAQALDQAIALFPNDADAHWCRGLVALLQGDFSRGFQECEARWGLKGRNRRSFPSPAWNGGALAGRRLLLTAEQGMGDIVQFFRYVPVLARAGISVVVECQPPLIPLLRRQPGICEAVALGDPLPPHDAHVHYMSLPRVLGTRPKTLPAEFPYLAAAPDRIDHWRRRIGPGAPAVGLVWAGNPNHAKDYLRSMPLAALTPLLELPDIRWYSLQTGGAALNAAMDNLTDLAPELTDFAETAAALMALDLVICVDTAIAHLAGALGRPAWVLLPSAPEWRWGREPSRTPWYPSLKLFRQSKLGDWDQVVGTVRQILTMGLPS